MYALMFAIAMVNVRTSVNIGALGPVKANCFN